MTPRERDEFRRIHLTAELERARQIVTLYDQNQRTFRRKIEDSLYQLGKLDERLGG